MKMRYFPFHRTFVTFNSISPCMHVFSEYVCERVLVFVANEKVLFFTLLLTVLVISQKRHSSKCRTLECYYYMLVL